MFYASHLVYGFDDTDDSDEDSNHRPDKGEDSSSDGGLFPDIKYYDKGAGGPRRFLTANVPQPYWQFMPDQVEYSFHESNHAEDNGRLKTLTHG